MIPSPPPPNATTPQPHPSSPSHPPLATYLPQQPLPPLPASANSPRRQPHPPQQQQQQHFSPASAQRNRINRIYTLPVDESFDVTARGGGPLNEHQRDSNASSNGGKFGATTSAIDYLRTQGGTHDDDDDVDEEMEASFLQGRAISAAASTPLQELNVSALQRRDAAAASSATNDIIKGDENHEVFDPGKPRRRKTVEEEEEEEEDYKDEEGFCAESDPLNIIPTKVIRTRLESLSRPSTADPSLIPSSTSSSTEPPTPQPPSTGNGAAASTTPAAANHGPASASNNRIRNTALEEGRPSSSRSRPSLLHTQKSSAGGNNNNNHNNNSVSVDTPSSSRPGSMQTSLMPVDAPFHHSLTPTMEDGAGGDQADAQQPQLLHEGSASSQSRNVTMTPIMSTDEGMGGADGHALPNVESPEKVVE